MKWNTYWALINPLVNINKIKSLTPLQPQDSAAPVSMNYLVELEEWFEGESWEKSKSVGTFWLMGRGWI